MIYFVDLIGGFPGGQKEVVMVTSEAGVKKDRRARSIRRGQKSGKNSSWDPSGRCEWLRNRNLAKDGSDEKRTPRTC